MKVAIVVPVFVTGGAENMAAQLAVHLKKQGTDVEVISMYPRQGHVFEEKIEKAGVPLHYMDKQRNMSIKAMLRLWKTLSDMKPDVVHGHLYASFYALPWVMMHQIKLVRTIHAQPDQELTPLLRYVSRVGQKIGKIQNVTISKVNQQIACRVFHSKPEVYPYVNNPVETDRFYRAEKEANAPITFINVCRLHEDKNLSMAIRAMADVVREIPNARLVLVGDGELRQELEQERDALGLEKNVEFAGMQRRPEDFLARADVFVLSSNMEGLPLAVLEAMAAGLPVISTDIAGLLDLIKDNGVLISAGDQKELARQMLRFARDPELRERCGKASLELIEPYRAENCAREYIRVYESVCRK